MGNGPRKKRSFLVPRRGLISLLLLNRMWLGQFGSVRLYSRSALDGDIDARVRVFGLL